MPKCIKSNPVCGKDATRALKLLFYKSEDTVPAPAFINLSVCEDHRMPDKEVEEFLTMNWEALCVGFEQVGQQAPKRELTKWSWEPWADAVAFFEEGEKAAHKHTVYEN